MTDAADTSRLPIIDLGLLATTDVWRDHVAAQIDWAASEYGFFYVIGHGVDPGSIGRLLRLGREFFARDPAYKEQFGMASGGRAWRGYFPVGGELTSGRPDRKEGLYFGRELPASDERVLRGVPLHGPNVFPDLPGFRAAVLDYMQAMTVLGRRLLELVGLALRIPDECFAEPYGREPTTLFRMFSYPPGDGPEGSGVGEHTDYGLLTLLLQDDTAGLEVRHGNRWLDIPPLRGSLVVNVGDMLEYLTSGRYTSALHRVTNRTPHTRLSMPFFFDPAFDAALRPIPGVRPWSRDRHPRACRDHVDPRSMTGTYGDYLVGKVAKVFPELGRAHLGAEVGHPGDARQVSFAGRRTQV